MLAKPFVVIQQLVEVVAGNILKFMRSPTGRRTVANLRVSISVGVDVCNIGTEVGREFKILQEGDFRVATRTQHVLAEIIPVQHRFGERMASAKLRPGW